MLEATQILITQFRRWAEEVKRLITSTDYAEHTLTSGKINGRNKTSLMAEIRNLVRDHESSTNYNPHQNSADNTNVYRKQEFLDKIKDVITLETFPMNRLPQTTARIVGTNLRIEGFVMILRGGFVPVPAKEIALPAENGRYIVALDVVRATPNAVPVATLVLIPSLTTALTGQNTTTRTTFGVLVGAAGVWTVTTAPQDTIGGYAVTNTPRGNAIPVSLGKPTEVQRLPAGWRP